MNRFLFMFSLLSLVLLVSAYGQQNKVRQLAISEAGLGPITAKTPATLARIAELWPSFRVIRGVASSEGIEFPTIRVMDGRSELFVIVPDEDKRTIVSIVVEGARVLYGGKTKVGTLYSQVYGDRIPSDCVMGAEEESGNVICGAFPGSHVRFIFAGTSDRLDGGMPALEVLKKWRIRAMFWHP